MKIRNVAAISLAVIAAAVTIDVKADGELFDGMSYTLNGFIRTEDAIKTNNIENPNNQGGNAFQHRSTTRQAFLPPELAVGLLPWGTVPLPYRDTITRSDFVPSTNNYANYTILRGETELAIKFSSSLDFIARVRAIYQPSDLDEFNAASLSDEQGGISGGSSILYKGRPNYFNYVTEGGGKNSQPLEWSGRNYQVYFPALVMNYHKGDLNLRVGNQQIAWGQALFLRTFDMVDGLDFRRHLILDRALEEYSDKRVPMLSVRLGYQLTDEILIDSYLGKFQPGVYANPNTPYNVIPTQFTVHDQYKDSWSQLNYGIRFKAEYGNWGWQAAYSRRYNPDGVFAWTESGVHKPFQGGPLSLGQVVNGLVAVVPGRTYPDAATALSHTPFEASPGGVYSDQEWFDYAARTRLSALDGFNAAVNEFPAMHDIFQTPVANEEQLRAALNTDFMAGGGSLRGHISRQYFQENVFALGGSYVLESENDFLNQLIFNLETQYTPRRVFTAPSLSTHHLEEDEYTISLVVDKWQRFFNNFPGTYIVTEFETKQRSDLVGRNQKGFQGTDGHSAPGRSGNANYFVFGFTQPFPNKTYELEFATLYDLAGGILVQPGVRYNPGHSITVEGHYNFLSGGLYGNSNNNVIKSIDYMNEFTLRLTYQF